LGASSKLWIPFLLSALCYHLEPAAVRKQNRRAACAKKGVHRSTVLRALRCQITSLFLSQGGLTAAIWNRAVQEAKVLVAPDADFPLSATLEIAEREAWSAISRQQDAAANDAWIVLPRDEQERRAAAPAEAALAALPALAGMRANPACAAMFCMYKGLV